MKRDWDTVRDILTKLESLPSTDHYLSLEDFELTDVSDAYAISYHMELLIEAGLVEGKMSRVLGGGPINFTATRLTWTGHEFLDAICSDTVWSKTKETFATKGLDMTFDLIKTVAGSVATSLLF
ncbi:hypothetical protein KAM338_48250 [Aeromonas caviae]|uniref:DUF2513 domain-containing protein n=1 Tax=Aeromonas hydrophila TaxID=644 RepID=UPI001680E426|nr:DUF2513 domain-containing protein [Aeromonas hydrophila]BCK63420.1 hypothetical protein KAM330_24090 [Aeromonas hydrophila]GKQ64648.1 hypothetical protein KAM338_48250 [Aeromonas caviae]